MSSTGNIADIIVFLLLSALHVGHPSTVVLQRRRMELWCWAKWMHSHRLRLNPKRTGFLYQAVASWDCEGDCRQFCHFQGGPLHQPARRRDGVPPGGTPVGAQCRGEAHLQQKKIWSRHTAPPWCSPLDVCPIPHWVQALSSRHSITSRSYSRVPARLLHWDSDGYDHLKIPISVFGGWGLTSAIVLSLPPVLDAGTVSLLLFVLLTQWIQLKCSLKLTCSLRLTLFSFLWGALVAVRPRYCAL